MTVFQQTVEAVKAAYPKFSPACLSLSCRTHETGVTMTAKAMKLADSVERARTPYRTRKENRKKSVSFRCRLAQNAAEIVKDEMSKKGVTQQELLEGLLMEWAEKSRSTAGTEERQEVGKASPSISTYKNNTNI